MQLEMETWRSLRGIVLPYFTKILYYPNSGERVFTLSHKKHPKI